MTVADFAENNWWKVNLQGLYYINQIVIWNRTDGYSHRLSNATVEVLDQDGDTVISSYNTGDATEEVKFVFDMSVIGASWVRVRLPTYNYLSLAEVQVFGYVSNVASVCFFGIKSNC